MATSTINNIASIVETGTEGDWTYRKWSDGTAECWRAWSSGAYSGTLVNGWYCRDFNGLQFPTDLFIEAPFVSFSLYSWNTGYYWGGVRNVNKATFGITTFNNASSSGVANGKIYAIGKWK